MNETRWWGYVVAVAGDVQNKVIADHVGIDKSNLTRWAQGSRPAVEFVLKFARAYNQPVVAALAAAEYITDAEARIREIKVGVADLSTTDLARELLARVESSEKSVAVVTPLRRNVRARGHDETVAASDDADWQARQEEENE